MSIKCVAYRCLSSSSSGEVYTVSSVVQLYMILPADLPKADFEGFESFFSQLCLENACDKMYAIKCMQICPLALLILLD